MIDKMRFDELTLTPNYKNASVLIEAYDIVDREDVRQSVSFLDLVTIIFPKGLGQATIGIPYEGIDKDCGAFTDYKDIVVTPFEFIGEIFEATDTEYKMSVNMKTLYRQELESIAQELLNKKYGGYSSVG